MENLSKKEVFKYLIAEFHNESLPETIRRDLEVPLMPKKVITLYGPRRAGKSFYLFSLINKLLEQGIAKNRIIYVNFEDDRILPLTAGHLQFLIDAYYELYPDNKGENLFFFFDEIQNIEGWEKFVTRIYEKEKVKVFVTGSSPKLSSREIATSLRGRTLSYALSPLNFNEFLRFRGLKLKKNFQFSNQRFKIKKLLREYIEWGVFPEVVLEDDVILRRKILEEYFNLLVFMDLAERFSLENMNLLKDLLKFLFTDITSRFSVNSYYNVTKEKISLSRETVSLYLSYIEESQYFFFPPLFSYSMKVQKVNPKKIVCIDNGLRNTAAFRFSRDLGKLAENLVGTILKWEQKELYYWQGKREVDFVFKEGNFLTAVNVCYSAVIKQREIDSLLEFEKKFRNIKKLILITEDLKKQEKGIEFIPLWKWLLNE